MTGHLKLVNRTGWDTRDVRRFVLAGLKAEVGTWYRYDVIVENRAANARYHGWGSYGAHWIRLLVLPADGYREDRGERYGLRPGWRRIQTVSRLVMGTEETLSMARTFAHEVQHNKGERHKDMTRSSGLPVEWAHALIAEGFRIRRAARPEPKPGRDLQADRRAHAEKMLARHEAALRRETKLVRKWRAKVRYYERAAERKAADVRV